MLIGQMSGCGYSTLEYIKTENDYKIYNYIDYASVEKPLDNKKAEKWRIERLEKQLTANNYEEYEIVSREAIVIGKDVIFQRNTYKIYYTVKVK